MPYPLQSGWLHQVHIFVGQFCFPIAPLAQHTCVLAVRGLVSCISAAEDLCDILLLADGLLMVFQGCVVPSMPH